VLYTEPNVERAVAMVNGLGAEMPPAIYARMLSAVATIAGANDPVRAALVNQAKTNQSPVVRLALASASLRLTPDQRKPIVTALLAHDEDKDDQNLPLM